MEFIVIDDERVAIPPEVVSEGRDAVATWCADEAARLRASKVVVEGQVKKK